MTRAMLPRSLARVARFLIASDPGRLRLRSASATTLSLVLAMTVLLVLTHVIGQPVTVAMLGTIVAMQSSAAVKDRDQRSRVITTLLLFFPATGAVSLAALLTPLGKVADVGFIVVLFCAVWVRRFGPRGNALGMVAFISYFFALFLRAAPHQIPILVVAIIVGLCTSLLVRTVILPERPRVEVRRLVQAFRAVSDAVLEAALWEATDRDPKVLQRRLDQLGETALMIDDWLDRNDAARLLSVTGADLALRVFDAQIATEQLVAVLQELPAPWPPELEQATAALGLCLQNNQSPQQLRAARKASGLSLIHI